MEVRTELGANRRSHGGIEGLGRVERDLVPIMMFAVGSAGVAGASSGR